MSDSNQLQMKPIDIPMEKPFANDLLDREDFVNAIAATFSTEGSAVIAIDGPWGSGKTTFAGMLACVLKAQGFQVVEVNAWNTDYTNDPLGALTHALLEKLNPGPVLRERLKGAAIGLTKEAIAGTIRVATGGIPSGELPADAAARRFTSFQEYAAAMGEFQDALHDLAANADKPLVLIVDELDRCKPTYAVDMLETVKHVFDIENVLFVLTVNRAQLDRSAAVLYGSASDPESYFSRFFDVELSLPEENKEAAIRALMPMTRLHPSQVYSKMLIFFLSKSPLGIRALGKMLRHYSVVAASFSNYQSKDWEGCLSTAMLLRLVIPEGYREFVRGDVSDAHLVDDLFSLSWASDLKGTEEGNYLEGTLISATERRGSLKSRASRLQERYLAESSEQDGPTESNIGSIIDTPVEWAAWADRHRAPDGPHVFWDVVKKIEMLR